VRALERRCLRAKVASVWTWRWAFECSWLRSGCLGGLLGQLLAVGCLALAKRLRGRVSCRSGHGAKDEVKHWNRRLRRGRSCVGVVVFGRRICSSLQVRQLRLKTVRRRSVGFRPHGFESRSLFCLPYLRFGEVEKVAVCFCHEWRVTSVSCHEEAGQVASAAWASVQRDRVMPNGLDRVFGTHLCRMEACRKQMSARLVSALLDGRPSGRLSHRKM